MPNFYDREGEEQNILHILHSQIKNLEDNMFIGETESLSVIKEAILKYTNDFFTKLEHLFAIENTFKYYVKNKDKIFKQELINLLP